MHQPATPADYQKAIAGERWLEQPFQTMNVAQALEILRATKEHYEQFHEVRYTDKALQAKPGRIIEPRSGAPLKNAFSARPCEHLNSAKLLENDAADRHAWPQKEHEHP